MKRLLRVDYKVVAQREDPVPYTWVGASLKFARQLKRQLLSKRSMEKFVSAKIYKETTYQEVEEIQ